MSELVVSVRWWRSPHVAWVAEPDRAVLLNLESDTPQPEELGGTAAAIWGVLDATPLRIEQILERLADEYGVAADAIRGDVETFLDALQAKGFAESSSTG
ncbi:PqqD family protein [Agromyces bauzanensis]